MNNNWTKWKSTALGLLALVIPIMVGVGWVKPELQGPILEKLPVVIEGAFGLAAAVFAFIGVFKLNDDG